MGEDGPFQFPCIFPVKVFGHNESAFRERAWGIVHRHYPELSADQVSENVSRNGKFLSMTFTLEAQDRKSLDELYQALSGDPQILMAL